MNSDFDLALYKRASEQMIATNDGAYNSLDARQRVTQLKDYTTDEIERIVNSGSLVEQQTLSRNYFYKNGFYRRIIMHYATLLKYAGILIPNPKLGKSLSNSAINKRYFNALDFVENSNLASILTNISIRALVDGTYYGVLVKVDKDGFSLLDLPARFCSSRFKDLRGNDIIEFDVTYFNTIFDPVARQEALNAYPDIISKGYKRYKNGKTASKWVVIPSNIGVCFPLFDGRPSFLNVIPATIEYDAALDTERERDIDEIRKIIVQKVPHLTDGGLLFEPEEAAEMHAGAVGMLRGNKNISVLTTYTDVDAITSRTSQDTANTTLEKMYKNIYSEGGVSSEVFATTGSSSLATSLKNDLAFMMVLGNKYSNFVTGMVNQLFKNGNIDFTYKILPISYYNDLDVANDWYKFANMGYSFLMPSIAMGISQRDLVNVKDLENNVLNMSEKLVSLTTAATGGANATGQDGAGRPALPEDQKSAKTIANEKSIENTGNGASE